jgi:hypothetical protein
MATTLQDRLQLALGDADVIERELAAGGMSRLFLATECSLRSWSSSTRSRSSARA